MRKSILATLAAATLFSSMAGVALAQDRGGQGRGSGGDGMEQRLRLATHNRYRPVGESDCMIEKVRRYDAYGNAYFERVRLCNNREVFVY